MNENIKTDVVAMLPENGMHELIRRIYGVNGLAPTLYTHGGG